MQKEIIRPVEFLKDDYNKFVAMREAVEAEVKAEFEKVIAERTARFDTLINACCETITIEAADEPVICEEDSEIIQE